MKLKLLLFFFSFIVFNAIAQSESNSAAATINEVDFLLGTWKVENKQTFEAWTKEENGGKFVGSSYKLINGKKRVTESLSVVEKNGKLVYSALVPNQNSGKSIDFTLNASVKDRWSFENLNHDFSKKIRYKKLDAQTLFVEVLGENDKGFSYKMIKQLK